MTEWQPIDSAPKDRKILVGRFVKTVCERNGRIAVDFWHNRKDHGYDGFGKFNTTHWPATHWQPLPEPPNDPR